MGPIFCAPLDTGSTMTVISNTGSSRFFGSNFITLKVYSFCEFFGEINRDIWIIRRKRNVVLLAEIVKKHFLARGDGFWDRGVS